MSAFQIFMLAAEAALLYAGVRLVATLLSRWLGPLWHQRGLESKVVAPLLYPADFLCLVAAIAVPAFGNTWAATAQPFAVALLGVAGGWLTLRLLTTSTYEFYFKRRRGIEVPGVLRAVLNALLYIAVILSTLKFSLGFDIGGLFITSAAAVSFVVGIALQDLLRGLFSGVLLSMDDPFRVGEFVSLGEFTGQVREMTWGTVVLRSMASDQITIPNARVLQMPVVNFSRSGKLHRCTATIAMDCAVPPNQARRMLRECALATPGALGQPEPVIWFDTTRNQLNEYRVEFAVGGYQYWHDAVSEFRSLVWYRLRRLATATLPENGIDAATPTTPASGAFLAAKEQLLAKVPLLATLAPAQAQLLAQMAHFELYGAAERVFSKGDVADQFYAVKSGQIIICVDGPLENGVATQQVLTTLGPRAFFGERALLTGDTRSAHAVASEDTELLVVNKAVFQTILLSDSQIAERLSASLAELAERDRARNNQANPLPAASRDAEQKGFLLKIRAFFQLDE